MNNILGLDISTTTIGFTVISENDELIQIGYIKPEGEDFIHKIDSAVSQLISITSNISLIVAEAPNIMFSRGLSSAQVISKILRFNGAFLYSCYRKFNSPITEIMASSARKNVTGKGRYENVKQDIFDWVKSYSHSKNQTINWPTIEKGKKQGEYSSVCFDISDSYILAQYGRKSLSN